MNITINITEPIKRVQEFREYDLGQITTTLQDLLDNSSITIESNIIPILKVLSVDNIIKNYLIKDLTENLYNTQDYITGQDLTEDDLILFVSESQILDLQNKLEDALIIQQSTFMGTAEPAATPTGTGNRYWVAVTPGTYTNFGGVVVTANSLAVISRSAAGTFSISQTALDISSKVNVSDIVDNLTTDSATKVANARQVKLLNENKAGLVPVKNMFNKATITVDKYVSDTNGLLITQSGLNASDFIAVLPSTNYYYSNSGSGFRAYYDANKNYISGVSQGYTIGTIVTTPANTYYIRVTLQTASINTAQLELGSVATAYNFYEVALQGSKIPQEIARKTDLVSSKNIACFGDSITADVYPTNLLGLLGNGYNVVNNGCSSAWLQDISARFGGVPALLLNDLAIPAGTTPFVLSGINNKYQTGSFQIAPRYNLDRAQAAYSPLTIDNEDFNMVLTESGGVVTATLSRVSAGTAFTIKAGTKIYPASLTKWRNGYTPVFFMGTNNVAVYNFDLPTYTPTIINYHKDCLKLVESSNFLILGLFNISQRIYARDLIPSASPTNADLLAQYVSYELQMTNEFGLNFIPLRKYLSSRKAIDDAVKLGYMTSGTATTNTSNDDLWIGRGCAAYSFMEYAGGTDYTHPNSVGYKMIAWYVYNALKKLGL